MTVIGDSPPTQEETVAASLPMSVITAAELIDEDSYVNDANKSGKKLGAMYHIEGTSGSMNIAVASGPLQNDPWALISSTGITVLTPTVATDISADLTESVASDIGTDLTATVAADIGTDLVLTTAGDVGDAAAITVQMNLVENEVNSQIDTLVTQLNLIETENNTEIDNIVTQLNLIEAGFNTQIDAIVTQLNLIETAVNSAVTAGSNVITPA